jgi:F0F1-type ATP synthase alpha subunit
MFLDLMEREMKSTVDALAKERALSDDIEAKLKEAIASFKSTNTELYTV